MSAPTATTITGDALLARLSDIVGGKYVLTGDADTAVYRSEPRGYYHGRTPAVVRPASADEISAILKLANETGVPIVPQGGNTGLVGGQTPDESGREVVLSLERMEKIRAVDPDGGTITAEAGVILERLQEASEQAGMLFPLSLGAQGSCRIGGNISTNAGGTAVLAYGNTRNLVLGLELVLPTGEIWNGLRSLVKDNSGYDLKQLFIGAEGTLGIVTAAVLKLFPRPRGQAVAFVGVPSPSMALKLFRHGREAAGGGLTAFELMPRILIELLSDQLPGARDPLASAHPWYVLLEVSSGRGDADARELVERALATGLQDGSVTDATVAASLDQANLFWRMRHGASEIQKHAGASIKHDISVPIERVPDFIARAVAAVSATMPGIRPVPFGHLGDGNLHFNFSQPVGMDRGAFLARRPELHGIVHGLVKEFGGSLAAEHGIGRYKRELLRSVKSEIELEMMRKIKRAFDPNNILNPGRVI
jgi:FAD/FMN-containing dehydrogenase